MGVLIRYFSPDGLRASLPSAKMTPPDPKNAEEDSKFGSRYLLIQACTVIVGILFAWSTHTSLVRLNRYVANADGPADYHLWPSPAIWWFFPGFGAITLAWPIVLQIWSDFISRPAAYSFNYWWAQSAGYDSTKALERLALFLTSPIGVLTILALSMHASIRQNDIRECRYGFAPCKTYLYSGARRLTLTDELVKRNSGEIVRGAVLRIDFEDGRHWSSSGILDADQSIDPAIVQFMKKKTQLRLIYADSEADIPPLDVGH